MSPVARSWTRRTVGTKVPQSGVMFFTTCPAARASSNWVAVPSLIWSWHVPLNMVTLGNYSPPPLRGTILEGKVPLRERHCPCRFVLVSAAYPVDRQTTRAYQAGGDICDLFVTSKICSHLCSLRALYCVTSPRHVISEKLYFFDHERDRTLMTST